MQTIFFPCRDTRQCLPEHKGQPSRSRSVGWDLGAEIPSVCAMGHHAKCSGLHCTHRIRLESIWRCPIQFCPVESSSLCPSVLCFVTQTMGRSDMGAIECYQEDCWQMLPFLPFLPKSHISVYCYIFTPLQCRVWVQLCVLMSSLWDWLTLKIFLLFSLQNSCL